MSTVIIQLPICQACGKVVHKPVHEMGYTLHAECWDEFAQGMNEFIDDMKKLEDEDPWADCPVHNFTPTQQGLCQHCCAPTKEDCIGENLREVIDICDL